jgi:hypothetical protein
VDMFFINKKIVLVLAAMSIADGSEAAKIKTVFLENLPTLLIPFKTKNMPVY